MTMPGDDAMTEPVAVRRIEVFTGAGQRRAWSAQDKARIVAESYSGLESVCAVARRYGLAQGQLFTRRREARTELARIEAPFAPAPQRQGRPRRRATVGAGLLEGRHSRPRGLERLRRGRTHPHHRHAAHRLRSLRSGRSPRSRRRQRRVPRRSHRRHPPFRSAAAHDRPNARRTAEPTRQRARPRQDRA